jgi:hypothetical protein
MPRQVCGWLASWECKALRAKGLGPVPREDKGPEPEPIARRTQGPELIGLRAFEPRASCDDGRADSRAPEPGEQAFARRVRSQRRIAPRIMRQMRRETRTGGARRRRAGGARGRRTRFALWSDLGIPAAAVRGCASESTPSSRMRHGAPRSMAAHCTRLAVAGGRS